MKNLQVLALDKKMDASVRTVNAIHRLLMDRNSLTAVSPSPPILSRSATPQLSPTSSVQYLDRWFFSRQSVYEFFKQWRFLKSECDTGIDCFFSESAKFDLQFSIRLLDDNGSEFQRFISGSISRNNSRAISEVFSSRFSKSTNSDLT